VTEPKRDPFILDRKTGRRLRARDALICIGATALLLLLFEGRSIRNTGERMSPGIERDAVLAIGRPAGWLADQLPLADALDSVTGWVSPDDKLTGPGSFTSLSATTGPRVSSGGGGPIGGAFTPDYFDPAALGKRPVKLPALRTLLVTGDSMAQPLDVELARRLSGAGVKTVRDAHLGTAISTTQIVDWGQLSVSQVRKQSPEAVVMFLGANEGFAMKDARGRDVNCCGPDWAALYATRAHAMMSTYRRGGAARVYWLTLPLPRDPRRVEIARAVNAAVTVAAGPFRAQVRVLDMASLFTPSGFRSAMDVNGKQTIVRRPDGIHLNDAGSAIAADVVEQRVRADFTAIGG